MASWGMISGGGARAPAPGPAPAAPLPPPPPRGAVAGDDVDEGEVGVAEGDVVREEGVGERNDCDVGEGGRSRWKGVGGKVILEG